jgi:hypothetical protein
MTFLWAFFWLICGLPHLSFYTWTDWTVALCVCFGLDLLSRTGGD